MLLKQFKNLTTIYKFAIFTAIINFIALINRSDCTHLDNKSQFNNSFHNPQLGYYNVIISADIPSKDVPQMITITFDDAINNNNIDLYKEMFNGKRKNPNGCNIKATVWLNLYFFELHVYYIKRD